MARWLFVFLMIFSLAAAGQNLSDLNEKNRAMLYLNEIRAQVGLPAFHANRILDKAANGHARYLMLNAKQSARQSAISAHDQYRHKAGFTGHKPADRALAAGYPHRQVAENITLGESDAQGAIDGLMSAIYHRFGFLDPLMDEIGIAHFGNAWVFLMGRADIRALCTNTPPEAKAVGTFDCHGTRVWSDYIDQFCVNTPVDALFTKPYPLRCPNGTPLKQVYMDKICANPPKAARFSGIGSYYNLCDKKIKIDKAWFDGICANPPKSAAYRYSGRYYQFCQPKKSIHAEWFEEYCANAPEAFRVKDGGRYTLVCQDEKRVRLSYFLGLQHKKTKANAAWLTWPPAGASGVPTVFFEEAPDPLPDRSVSGFPISIAFNSDQVKRVQVKDFALFEWSNDQWQRLTKVRLLDKTTDPNEKFDAFKFALFPLDRLQWGKRYRVQIDAHLDDRKQRIEWYFRTQEAGAPVIDISPGVNEVRIRNGEKSHLFWPPQPGNALPIQHVQTRYRLDVVAEVEILDPNVLAIEIRSRRCDSVELTLNKKRKITVSLAGCR